MILFVIARAFLFLPEAIPVTDTEIASLPKYLVIISKGTLG